MKREEWISIFIVMLVIALTGFLFKDTFTDITGHQTERITTSNVSVTRFFAIALSTNLDDGIEFGTVDPNSQDVNATDNYNGPDSNTTMSVDVSSDSNTNVNVCVRANTDLTNPGGVIIPLGGYTFSNSTANNITTPSDPSNTRVMLVAFQDTSQNIPRGSSDFFRFFLDIPAGQEAGTYNDTIIFRAVSFSEICGA